MLDVAGVALGVPSTWAGVMLCNLVCVCVVFTWWLLTLVFLFIILY